MDFHLGKAIRKHIQEHKIPVKDFALKLNISNNNAFRILNKKHLHTSLLVRICKCLNFDFFKHCGSGMVNEENLKQKIIVLENQYQKAEDIINHLKGEVDYLKEINALLKNEKH